MGPEPREERRTSPQPLAACPGTFWTPSGSAWALSASPPFYKMLLGVPARQITGVLLRLGMQGLGFEAGRQLELGGQERWSK